MAASKQPGRVKMLALPGIPMLQPGDDLPSVMQAAMAAAGETFSDDDILVVAQKIVSKVEGRHVELGGVEPSASARALAAEVGKDPRLVELILSESREVVAHRRGVLIVEHRLGVVMANAGIDHSNVEPLGEDGCVLLLPVDPDASAARLRDAVRRRWGAQVGIIVSDSAGRAWRKGTVGIALGAAGVPSLLDGRGGADLFGRPLLVTEIGLADGLAAAASILMGEADEGRPVVLIRGIDTGGQSPSPASVLLRDRGRDLFR